MNRGLIEKTVREFWLVTVLVTLGVFGFEILVAYALSEFQEELAKTWVQIEFLHKLIEGLVGADIGEGISPLMMSAIAWVHPVVLAIIWGFEITFATRVPAAEVDRATIDVLLGLPVSRWRVYICDTLVWLAAGVLLMFACVAGFSTGSLALSEEHRPEIGRLVICAGNLLCVYSVVGGLAFLVSARSNRRGPAVAVVLAVVLSLFLLNFLAQFWEVAEKLSWLSMMHYYRPVEILQNGGWPLADMAVLLGAAAVFWGIGGVLFSRRDICTV